MSEFQQAIFTFLTPFVAFFGACIGSFLSVCIYRIPRDESIVKPRSHCPKCGKLIPWYCNIPVFSWLALRGKCHYCKEPISPRYLILELITAILFTIAWMQGFAGIIMPEADLDLWYRFGNNFSAPEACWFGLTPILAPSHIDILICKFFSSLGLMAFPIPCQVYVYWLIIWGLVLGTFVDIEHYIIPDRVTIGGIFAGLALSPLIPELHFTSSWSTALIRSSIGFGVGFGGLWLIGTIGELIFKKEAMGFGDVKLMGAIGAFFGWKAVLFVLLAASFFGSVFGITLIALGKRQLQGRIPFGPFLAFGTILWMFWGHTITSGYFRLLFPMP